MYETSDGLSELIRRRGEALLRLDMDTVRNLDQEIQRTKRSENKTRRLNAVSKDLDLRDRWCGIRYMKQQYKPVPYQQENSEGRHITYRNRAEGAARHLRERQWGETDEARQQVFCTDPIITEDLGYNVNIITLPELRRTVKKFKRRKAPGPDNVPMEVFKEMDDEALAEVLGVLNSWWTQENVPEEQMKARVVLIFKKGNTRN